MDVLTFLPNLRTELATATTGYTWGKPVSDSNILALLTLAGFTELQQELGLANDDIVAERWLVSDDQQYPSLVVDRNTGQTKAWFELLADAPSELLGPQHLEEFGPYLTCVMKQLDTNDTPNKGSLSVQVHPKPGHPTRPAKPEMWQGRGKIYLGWKKDVTPAEISTACTNAELETLMNQIELTPDKLVVVAGGTIHAIRFGTFTAEWSMAPGKDDRNKGSLKDATVSPYDRTDGKQARPGKEDVAAAIELLAESDGMRGQTEAELMTTATPLWQDKQGNSLQRLFTTSMVFVHQLQVSTSYKLNLATVGRGLPMYVVQGEVHMTTTAGQSLTLSAGSECFVPYSASEVEIKNTSSAPSILQFWFAPFESERQVHVRS